MGYFRYRIADNPKDFLVGFRRRKGDVELVPHRVEFHEEEGHEQHDHQEHL